MIRGEKGKKQKQSDFSLQGLPSPSVTQSMRTPQFPALMQKRPLLLLPSHLAPTLVIAQNVTTGGSRGGEQQKASRMTAARGPSVPQ